MYRWALALVCVVACGAVLKPAEPNRRLDLRVSGEMFASNAGYEFAVLPEPGASVVRLDVRYPVGSVDDPPGKEGLAHLIEHLLFDVEITRGDRKTSINAELGRLALSWNAETSADYTTYQTLASSTAIDEILGLEAERLARGCSSLTPEIFNREREVVLNELRLRQGASGAAFQQAIRNAIYPAGHPYRAGDSVESVSKLDFKDVCDFLAGPYRQGTVMVIASGSIDGDELREAAQHHFANVSKRRPKTHAAPPVVKPVHEAVRLTADLDEPMIMITWPLPPAETHEARQLAMVYDMMPYQLDELAMMFGWGHSARVDVMGGEAAPVLVMSMTVSSVDHLDDLKHAADSALGFGLRMLGEDKDTVEWKYAWQARAEILIARWESLGSRNQLVADQLANGESALLIGRVQELTKDSPGSIRSVAKAWLDLDRARYIVVQPSGKPTARGKATYKGGAEAHATEVDPALADQPLDEPLPIGLKTVRYKLPNGLSVILWPHGSAPLVHGRLVIDAGLAQDPKNAEGVAELVGAQEVYEDQIVFSDREIATRVDELVRTLTTELRLPGYALGDDAKKFLKGRLRLKRGLERRGFDERIAAAVYGKRHPYARPLMSEQSLDHIHTDMIMDWARSHIVPSNATLIISGQFDPELIKRHIAYDADQVSAGDHTRPINAPVDPGETEWVSGVASKVSPNVELDMAFLGGKGIDAHFAERLVLAEVLNGRLQRLRGQQALTYGFSASFEPRRAGGVWLISGDADANRAGEAATSLVAIVNEMRQDPESYRADFVLARQKVIEKLELSATSSAEVADQLVTLARFDLADDFFDRLASDVSKLTLRPFHAFMVRELTSADQVIGAFGNADAVEAAHSTALAR